MSHLEEAEIRLKVRTGKFICKAFSALNRKLIPNDLKSNNYILVWLVFCSTRLHYGHFEDLIPSK